MDKNTTKPEFRRVSLRILTTVFESAEKKVASIPGKPKKQEKVSGVLKRWLEKGMFLEMKEDIELKMVQNNRYANKVQKKV